MREERIKNLSTELYDILVKAKDISDLESIYYTEEFKTKLKSMFAIATLEKDLVNYNYNYAKGSLVETSLDLFINNADNMSNSKHKELATLIDRDYIEDYYIIRNKIFNILDRIRVRRFNDIDNIIYNKNCLDNSVFKDSKTFSDKGFYESYICAYHYLKSLFSYEIEKEISDEIFFEYSFLIGNLVSVCCNILITEYDASLEVKESSSIEVFNYLVTSNYQQYQDNKYLEKSVEDDERIEEVKNLISALGQKEYNNILKCKNIREYVNLCSKYGRKASFIPDVILFNMDDDLHLLMGKTCVYIEDIKDVVFNLLITNGESLLIECIDKKSYIGINEWFSSTPNILNNLNHVIINLADYIDSIYGKYLVDIFYNYPVLFTDRGDTDICKLTGVPGKRTKIQLI